MKIRAAASAIATFIVAIVVALAVPVSQLRTVTTTERCCCPDPSRCHCPHEKAGTPDKPSMKPCHKERDVSVGPQLSSFVTPAVEIATATPRVVIAPIATPDAPRAPPVPDEPYGPS